MFIADYVLMGYGTGAIMAVPGQDERDWEFAERVRAADRAHRAAAGRASTARRTSATARRSTRANDEITLNGLDVAEAKARSSTGWRRTGAGAGTVTYKLRDWLFSRQRYWGEPFPIVYDETACRSRCPIDAAGGAARDRRLLAAAPSTRTTPTAEPEPPLSRATEWVEVELDLGDGPSAYRRETNTMPQWAGSCWYYLRYLDPDERRARSSTRRSSGTGWARDAARPDDPGGVDLYVGGVEHAVLHLLYARFWHKVLYDLGHVSSDEPFRRLFNQGYIQAYAYTDARGVYVPAEEVRRDADGPATSVATASRSAASTGRWARA